jgi:hypothetical protein
MPGTFIDQVSDGLDDTESIHLAGIKSASRCPCDEISHVAFQLSGARREPPRAEQNTSTVNGETATGRREHRPNNDYCRRLMILGLLLCGNIKITSRNPVVIYRPLRQYQV